MNIKHKGIKALITTTIAITGIIMLASCTAQDGEPAPKDTAVVSQPTAAPSNEPVETETPEQPEEKPVEEIVEELNAGDIVDAKTAETINSASHQMGTDRAYQLPSGEHVLIKAGEPVPTSVVDVVAARGEEAGGANLGSADGGVAPQAALEMIKAVDAEASAVGRTAIIVRHAMSATGPGTAAPMWGVTRLNQQPFDTFESAMVAAQGWVDQSPATRYIVVIDALN